MVCSKESGLERHTRVHIYSRELASFKCFPTMRAHEIIQILSIRQLAALRVPRRVIEHSWRFTLVWNKASRILINCSINLRTPTSMCSLQPRCFFSPLFTFTVYHRIFLHFKMMLQTPYRDLQWLGANSKAQAGKNRDLPRIPAIVHNVPIVPSFGGQNLT